ncbi:hypothetical protein BWQ96_03370 [Gracilariopsis chorda]|uniref:Uncharacterized protein n=1 Tax=Gracilariopsis chorda TaxID=448386 RepID=A0A2V3IXK1_9FLOR|nr:hypothetical protein BWQ96_03370 [Gracilariopsis chorda]|eukprot:PXF46841.1 hypothetical protein BWQ96_03370 [Gracilariopsis chorda]
MFYARIISGIIAFTAFIVSISLSSRLPVPKHLLPKEDNSTVKLSAVAFSYEGMQVQKIPLLLNGTKQTTADGTEFVFQIARKRQGTVLLIHGCSHSATDWFPASPGCRDCIGLPEEMRIVYISLLSGYSVVSVSSTDRKRKCWHTHPEARLGSDYQRVDSALLEAKNLGVHDSSKPLFVLGVSSGGLFASSLPLRFYVDGVISIVSSSVVSLWTDEFFSSHAIYTPHVFTHMAYRDGRTAQMVASSISKLQRMGVPCIDFKVDPKAVTPEFLTDALSHLNRTVASEIVAALNAAGHLDSVWRLISDPRGSSWRKALQHMRFQTGDTLVADASPLSEEMNRAWAGHEITSEYYAESLHFLEQSLRTHLQSTVSD